MQREILLVAKDEDIKIEDFFDALPLETQNHSFRVAQITKMLLKRAEEEGLCAEEPLPLSLEQIYQAVSYHDIGMVLVPDRIRNKIEELTGAEWKVVQKHTTYGAKILDKVRKSNSSNAGQNTFWRLAAEIALNHHERWDGRGYPYGQLATAVSIVPRATALADSYDTIVSGAAYRMALPPEYALLEIVDNAGTQFDPCLVKVFNKYFSDFYIE